jgi:hypothetical protein
MTANRLLGSTLILLGLSVAALTFIYGWIVSLANWPSLFRDMLASQALGSSPPFIDWFLIVLGVACAFYAVAILGRLPWSLLAAVILAGVLALFLLATAVLVVFPTDAISNGLLRPLGLLKEDNQFYRYGIAILLVLLAAAWGYSTTRLHGPENRQIYAQPYYDMAPPVAICERCGRILTPQGCPVHDRRSINGLLVREGSGERFPVTREVSDLGRDPSSHILFDKDANPDYLKVSRKQARIVWDNGGFYIANLSTKNPTQVDGQTLNIPPGEEMSAPVALHNGSRIVIGSNTPSVYMVFYEDAATYTG